MNNNNNNESVFTTEIQKNLQMFQETVNSMVINHENDSNTLHLNIQNCFKNLNLNINNIISQKIFEINRINITDLTIDICPKFDDLIIPLVHLKNMLPKNYDENDNSSISSDIEVESDNASIDSNNIDVDETFLTDYLEDLKTSELDSNNKNFLNFCYSFRKIIKLKIEKVRNIENIRECGGDLDLELLTQDEIKNIFIDLDNSISLEYLLLTNYNLPIFFPLFSIVKFLYFLKNNFFIIKLKLQIMKI